MARQNNSRWLFICLASFIFYGWWDWRYLFLMIGTALVDFYAGLAMARFSRHKKQILIFSLISNIGVLAFFKYAGFFSRSLNQGFAIFGFPLNLPLSDFILPLGISFYTFHSMSYTIDVYRGVVRPTRNVFHFLAYISLFPQLVAGPISRASFILPQLESWNKPNEKNIWAGLKLIAQGYFKKLVIADNLAIAVNQAYSAATPEPSFIYWWVVATMFSIQVYGDFSGYSDIARGLGKWMGYEIPVNFDHPYTLARSLRQFWSRWHITLSTWFRDYLYFPLGGSKTGRTYINIWITMGLMGLWHGAGWNFIAFGLLHAFFISIERATDWPQRLEEKMKGPCFSWALTLAQIWLAAAVFRSQSISQAESVVHHMLIPNGWNWGAVLSLGQIPLVTTGAAIILEIWGTYALKPKISENKYYRGLEPVFIALMLIASVYFRGPGNQFIYFQF